MESGFFSETVQSGYHDIPQRLAVALYVGLLKDAGCTHHRFFAYHPEQSAAGFEHGQQGERDCGHRTAKHNSIISLNRGMRGNAFAVLQVDIV